jgi:asparagine synthase (glutamine-hydrolysing)
VAEKQLTDGDVERIRAQHPNATINSKEAAYYFQIFRQFHPQDSILSSIGIWTGFDFAEERQPVQGTIGGDLKPYCVENRKEQLSELKGVCQPPG